jgi:hypothetical protein
MARDQGGHLLQVQSPSTAISSISDHKNVQLALEDLTISFNRLTRYAKSKLSRNLLFFPSLGQLSEYEFFCLWIFAKGFKVPTYTMLLSPMFKCLLIGVGNSNKE